MFLRARQVSTVKGDASHTAVLANGSAFRDLHFTLFLIYYNSRISFYTELNLKTFALTIA